MFVQKFYEKTWDFSLYALVIDGVKQKVVHRSRPAMLHSILLENLTTEIRKGDITKDPQTTDEILSCALLEGKGPKKH